MNKLLLLMLAAALLAAAGCSTGRITVTPLPIIQEVAPDEPVPALKPIKVTVEPVGDDDAKVCMSISAYENWSLNTAIILARLREWQGVISFCEAQLELKNDDN